MPAYFGKRTPSELAEAIHLGEIPQRRMVELPPVVLEEAATDPVAAELVDRLAAEVVAMAEVALRRLELLDEPVEVLLGGGMFQNPDSALVDAIRIALSGIGSAITVRATAAPPVVGAALLALDQLGAGPARRTSACVANCQLRARGRSMAEVRFEQATRIYPGTDAPALDALDLDIADGELMVLVGPSGSGKTTALRMLAGLEEVDAGAVYIGDRDVSDDPPKKRDVAMVFQNYALYPYLTVADNMGFPLRDREGAEGQARGACARGRRAARADAVPASASPGSCRAASASAWRWGARSSASRRST